MKKKTVKLTIATLLGAGLITCFCGCGEKDPYEIYSEASKKTNELKSTETSAKMTMTLSAEGSSFEIPMNMDIKVSGVGTDNILMDMQMNLEILGQSVTTTGYYTDGYYYMDDSTAGKIKYAMDLEALQEQISTGSAKTDLKKEDFEELTVEKKDKDYILTFKLKKDSLNETIDSALGSMGDMLSGIDMNIELSDINGTMTVNKDGYIASQQMTIPMTTAVEGQEMTLDIDLECTYVDPGKEVTVELPADLDTYEEVSMTDPGNAVQEVPDETANAAEAPEASAGTKIQPMKQSQPIPKIYQEKHHGCTHHKHTLHTC